MIWLWTAVAVAGKPVSPSGTTLEASQKGFGAAVSDAGDVNGDGFADVIVGSYRSSAGTGAAYVFMGSKHGISTDPAAVLVGTVPGDSFGFSVSSAGDVNGDGFDDVVVGSNSNSNGEVGLFLGSADGLSTVAATTLSGGAAFGYSVAGAGDIDKDGFDDILVGKWTTSANSGAVSVYRGTPDGLDETPQTLEAPEDGGYFGWSLDGIGDMDGDGFDDIVVGAWSVESAYIFKGSAAGIATDTTIALSGPADSYFGQAVAGAGDVNGDGHPDVVIGAPGGPTTVGRVAVYLGSAADLATTPWATWSGEDPADTFGRAVAGAGDLDKDGFSDILVGAPGVAEGAGAVFVFGGTDKDAPTKADQTLEGAAADDQFGWAVSGAGDIDGDERTDILVGADGSGEGAGSAVIFMGGGCGCSSGRGAPAGIALFPLFLLIRRRTG
jgi:MYXO-CTERM domain-containing protein